MQCTQPHYRGTHHCDALHGHGLDDGLDVGLDDDLDVGLDDGLDGDGLGGHGLGGHGLDVRLDDGLDGHGLHVGLHGEHHHGASRHGTP